MNGIYVQAYLQWFPRFWFVTRICFLSIYLRLSNSGLLLVSLLETFMAGNEINMYHDCLKLYWLYSW